MQGNNMTVDGKTGPKFNTLSLLTAMQRLPTPFISAFMLVHLSAPLIASIGGSSASSQVMVSTYSGSTCRENHIPSLMAMISKLLGREYYQGRYTEPLLVFAPIGVHVASSLARRILLSIKSSSSTTPLQSKSILANIWKKLKSTRLVTLSAYPALAFFAIHIETYRLRPSLPAPPISALSPSELDYEFVKYGLQTYPLWASVTFGGLVFAMLYHASEGAVIVLRAWTAKTKWGSGFVSFSTMRRRRAVAVAGLSIFTGLLVLWIEPLEAGTRMVTRYSAVYNQ
jgi:succinate dehydrogenase/fumarate reductase cytochrome b subunit